MDSKVEIAITITWANTLARAKDLMVITKGSWAIGNNRKPPALLEWSGATLDGTGKGGAVNGLVAKVQAMASGDFPNLPIQVVVPDPRKMIKTQTATLSFTWPADAKAGDSMEIQPSFKTQMR